MLPYLSSVTTSNATADRRNEKSPPVGDIRAGSMKPHRIDGSEGSSTLR